MSRPDNLSRRYLEIDERQRSQSLVPLRARFSESVPGRDITDPLFYYSCLMKHRLRLCGSILNIFHW